MSDDNEVNTDPGIVFVLLLIVIVAGSIVAGLATQTQRYGIPVKQETQEVQE